MTFLAVRLATLALVGWLLLEPACSPADRNPGSEPATGAPPTTDQARAPAPDGEPPEPHEELAGNWTIGRTAVEKEVAGVATLLEVRWAAHADFDRVVFSFAGDGLPSYEIEYVDRPVRECGSGDPVELAGDGWLSVRFAPGRAHDDDYRATITERNLHPRLPVVLQLRVTCDFEAVHEWVLGVSSPNPYRVMELRSPSRLVLDVSHGRR